MTADTPTTVGDVMTTPMETVSATATIRTAASTMRNREINALLVPGGETGIVTSTDVLDAVAAGRDPESTTVGDVMTVPVESVTVDLQLSEAAAMLTNYCINHLPVRDSSGDYVGMVSSTDMRETLVES